MNTVGWGLLAATACAGLGPVAALVTGPRLRAVLVGLTTAGVGIGGLAAGLVALGGSWGRAVDDGWTGLVGGERVGLGGDRFVAELPWLLPLGRVRLELDPLGALFVLVVSGVVAAAALYGAGYARGGHGPAGRTAQAALPLFAWAMLMVPCAGSVSALLLAWELMAITSLVLVVAEHRKRAAVAEAGVWYGALTQIGFVAILMGMVLFGAFAGGDAFDDLRQADLAPALRGVVFVLILLGFGSKAGLIPVHVWLPRAHSEAPSSVSAMLSAAMVSLGAYGVIRVGFDLLDGGSRWWWLVALAAGAASALYGILQAAVATDLKRLLAYSTVENMGLVFVGIGAAGVFRASAAPVLAALALAAALLHVANHAAFKALLFMSAGSVVRATGTRDLDALGGLRARMPATTALFAGGALAASALPPGNGFISEWMLLQSLVHAVPAGGVVTAVAMPIAVAVVALTAGIAVATFVKALGVGFFARPRSDAAAGAVEAPAAMVAAMAVLALACLGLGLAPAALGSALSRAVGVALDAPADLIGGDVTLRLSGIASTVSPAVIAGALIASVAVVAVLIRLIGVRVRRRQAVALWDCGAGPPTERMQYTATSFAEPLQRVFDDVLAPETDVDVTPYAESRYLVARVAYQQRVPDRIEHRLYAPIIAAGRRLGRVGAILANGSVHRYLAYGFLGVVGLLVSLAVMR